MSEIWKPIPGFDDLYEASNLGQARSVRNAMPKILKPYYRARGYAHLGLYTANSKYHCVFLHKAVFTAFNGSVPEGKEIDHIDGDPRNNALANLQAITRKENIRKAMTTMQAKGHANGRASQKECKWGHPYDEENTLWSLDRRRRTCRACKREAYLRRKEATA